MTGDEFNYLKAHPDEVKPEQQQRFKELLDWEKRSKAAKAAVLKRKWRKGKGNNAPLQNRYIVGEWK